MFTQTPLLKGVGLIFSFFLVVQFSSAQVTSDFASSADGWTIFNTSSGSSSAAVYNSTGGNPAGYISDPGTTSGGTIFYAEAPAKFHGNFSSSYNQNLSFDLKQSTAGTDNTSGDIIITGSGGSIYFQLTTKPGTASFSSYSIQLKETVTGWHYGSPVGATPTQTQMKQALSNITSLRIRLKYTTSNTFTVTGSLDNVVLNVPTLGSAPTITSFTPTSAVPGATMTITGTNFNTTASQNVIYFKGIRAIASSATATQLTVTIPKSAAYGPISVTDLSTGLQGSSTQSFNPLFDNNKDFGGQIIPASMGRGYNVILPMSNSQNTYSSMDKGDLDGDGWVDLVTSETGSTKIYAFRNLGTGGTVSTSSFAAGITLTGLSTIPGGSPGLGPLTVVDVDNDGKPDIAAVTSSPSSGFLAVFRNTSTVGSISFASPQFFAYPYYSNQLYMTSGDIDSDGRVDFLYTTGTSPGGIWVNQNLSSPGNVDFAYGVSIGSNASHSDVKVADLNSDGKPEVIAGTGFAAEIYPNTSSPGTISLGTSFSITTTSGTYFAIADLDADNKADLIWSAYGAQYIYMSKNNYNGSTFDATSFGSQIAISSKLSNPDGLNVSDINSDGKPDIVIVGSSDVGIMQNIGSAGALSSSSFFSPTLFQGSATGSFVYGLGPSIADLDGDNKPEVVFVYSNSSIATGEKGIYIFHNESFPAPKITGTTPTSGATGVSVAINGDLMFTGNVSPTVRSNKISSTINGSPTNTLTTVTTSIGSISGKFSVTNHGLTAYSPYFKTTFGTTGSITASSFGPGVDFALNINTRDALDVADFDDDGKMDIAVIDNYSTCNIFKNAATAGQTISSSSLTLQATTYTGGYNLFALDIDGDGKVDLNNGYGLLQNSSSPGTISFLSGPNGIYTYAGGFNGVTSGDFNKDGKIDLAVTNGGANLQVYENQSSQGVFENNGNFSTYNTTPTNLAKPNTYGGVVAGDFDGDGYDDLISTNSASANLTYYLNTKAYGPITSATFSFLGNYGVTGSQPYSLTANDFDGDGKIDIAVTYFNSAFVSVMRNTSVLGDISFSGVDITCNNKGYNITSQDLDGDGKPEVIVIHQPNPGPGSFTIFKNNSTSGNVSFAAGVNFPLSRNPQAINIADINSDQKPDILIVASGGSTSPANALMVFENKIATPSISMLAQPPPNYPVCDGTPATMTALATGTTNITYQWQFSSTGSGGPFTDISNSGGYSNVATSSLTINSTGNFGAGTYRCKINGDFASTVYSNTVSFSVNPLPAAPTAANVNFCPPNTVVLTASGGSNGQYVWYDQNGVIPGEVNSTYTTPTLLISTFYVVAITDGTCRSNGTNLQTVAQPIPAAPAASDVNFCQAATVLLTASGGSNGQYRWYDQNGLINGQTGNTYTTPSISSTTSYSVAIDNGFCASTMTNMKAVLQATPAAPTAADVNFCPPNVVQLTASGGSNGQYLWYDQNGVINGQTNAIYATPSISSTTSYSVAINNGFCTSAKSNVKAVAQVIPTAPTAIDVNFCPPNTVQLTASGGSNGQYLWYDQNGLINGQTSGTYITPSISSTTSYSVAINNGFCSSTKTSVKAVVAASGCSAPVITPEPLATQVGGTITIDLKPLISTPGSSLNLSSLQIVVFPSSGATASIDANGILTITYSGITFSGKENITIKACDINHNCTQQQFGIEVAGDIEIFNGVSPGGANPKFIIQYIELLAETKNNKVYIFDRWENLVWHGTNYDNSSVVFTGNSDSGNALPSGVYFYKIDFASGRSSKTGFISLRR